MAQSLAKNLMYNILFQVITLILPLITVPYVSRTLGVEGIGTYSYTLSITQYFIIIGTLGLSTYGNRQIAYTRDNKEKMSRTFWSLLALRFITTSLAIVLYLVLFSNIKEYKGVYLIQTINIVATMIDISWLYIGLEEFKKTVTRNLIVKVIGVCLIFTFIRTTDDLNLYVLINVMMTLFGNVVMWMYLPGTVNKVKLNLYDITIHLVPSIQMLIPQIAIQIYVVLDKTMLGALTSVVEVGYYDQAEKIVKAVIGLLTALGTVMLPRMSNIFANGDENTMDDYLNTSLKGVTYVSVPMLFGIASISNEFVPWFFGYNFMPVRYLIIILSPILFFIAIGNVLGTQYLLPSNRTREFTVSVVIGAVINVILNLLLIPHFKAIGSCVATVIAELSIMAVQYYYLRTKIKIYEYLKGLFKYTLAAIIMFLFVRLVGFSMGVSVVTIISQCFTGVIVYIVVLTMLGEKVNTTLFSTVFNKISKKVS